MTTYASNSYAFGTATRQLHYRKDSSDEAVIAAILGRQQYDLGHIVRVAELMDYAKRAEASGRKPLIVDAGANIGAASIFFAAKMPGARIVAIEPDQENFQLLCRNVEGLGVETINAAVSSTAGRARVVDPGRGPWAYRTQPVADDDTATGAVPRITINDIFQAHTVATYPFIVKIDIEGAEADLFSGNTEWVARSPLIIVELHDWLLPKAKTSRPFLQCISRLDRDFIYRGEDVYSIANDFDALAQAGG